MGLLSAGHGRRACLKLTQMVDLGIDLFSEKHHAPVAVHGQVDVRDRLIILGDVVNQFSCPEPPDWML